MKDYSSKQFYLCQNWPNTLNLEGSVLLKNILNEEKRSETIGS